MFAKLGLLIGGLAIAVASVAAADMYFVREEVVTVDFARQVVDDVLDDPEAREPLVDRLTEAWVDANGLERLDSTSAPARRQLRQAIDSLVSGESFRAEIGAALDDLALREDELGIEEITIDLRPAIDDAAARLSSQAISGFSGGTVVTLSADLAPLSAARRGMTIGTIVAIGLAVMFAGVMLSATSSPRRTIRAIVLFGLPISLLQPAILAGQLEKATFGDLRSRPIVTNSISERLEPRLGLIFVIFALLAVVELVAFVATKLMATRTAKEPPADTSVEEHVPRTGPAASPYEVDWLVKERYEDRHAA